MPILTDQELARRAAELEWLLCDVDGVLTDGGLYYDRKGPAMLRFHVRDGLGLKLAQRAGAMAWSSAVLPAAFGPTTAVIPRDRFTHSGSQPKQRKPERRILSMSMVGLTMRLVRRRSSLL